MRSCTGVFKAIYYPLGLMPMIGDAICRFKGRAVWEVAADSSMDPAVKFGDVVDRQDNFGS